MTEFEKEVCSRLRSIEARMDPWGFRNRMSYGSSKYRHWSWNTLFWVVFVPLLGMLLGSVLGGFWTGRIAYQNHQIFLHSVGDKVYP